MMDLVVIIRALWGIPVHVDRFGFPSSIASVALTVGP